MTRIMLDKCLIWKTSLFFGQNNIGHAHDFIHRRPPP
jgi:hypothetical protein